ncbi:hypothetical protein AS594_38130 [Streptomyces agglomeratus]|uniref:Uncharacterized protein n=1 Tax=Streptomyces agglomeratus TaxID=285458 RepID=A0A1E5NYK4_9ACTN|nr:winged helix-turn-helix domain-containing protein [Streptomyces agglomeratus]OEJ21400.1 hypothetical protein AS594_38130 [Streptomyces agglomeratus]
MARRPRAGLVRDHAHDSQFDGQRLIVACSPDHLDELIEQVKRRPFLDDELWAGKIARVLQQHPGVVSAKELAEKTGLSQAQVRVGVKWQKLELNCWHEQCGEKGSPQDDK